MERLKNKREKETNGHSVMLSGGEGEAEEGIGDINGWMVNKQYIVQMIFMQLCT